VDGCNVRGGGGVELGDNNGCIVIKFIGIFVGDNGSKTLSFFVVDFRF
jgi:hypothetical protein